MKNKLKENKGYSLIELIISIGIIAVLSGMSLLTVSTIKSSRASAAKDTFNQALSSLQTITKTQIENYAMQIYKDGKDYKLAYGTYDGSTFSQDLSIDEDNLGRATIEYDGAEITENSSTYVVIQFKKSDGSVVTGDGVYTFYKEDHGNVVGTVTLNRATGSHYTGS